MAFWHRFIRRPGRDKFARVVLDGIRKAGETRKILYNPKQFRLEVEGDEGILYFLGNAYQEYCAATKEVRPKLLQRVVRAWFTYRKELPESFEDLGPDLLPAVRARAYYEFTLLQWKVDGSGSAHWPHQVVGDHLAVGLVYDLPESMRAIQQDDLDEWGVTFYEALEAARGNLVEKGEQAVLAVDDRLYISTTGDCYDASRLLLVDLIRRLAVKGDYVAMVPNRDHLIVTGAEDPDGLMMMADLAEKALQQPRPISGIALRLVGDEWTPWLPQREHPHHARFRMLQVRSLGQDYAEQKELLEALHAKQQEDVFVSSYSAVQDQAGGIFSYSVWSPDMISLLPKTDKVAFVRGGDEEPLLADWDRVVEAAGELMEPLDFYPQRFRVIEFPTARQLREMNSVL